MKKLKPKIIRKVLYHQNCEDLEECIEKYYGFPQHPILNRHGMVYIGYSGDYLYFTYVDSNGNFKKWGTKKVKKFSHKRLFKNLIKEKL